MSSKRTTYDFLVEPRGEMLSALLRASVEIARFFGVIVASQEDRLSYAATRLMTGLQPYLVRVEEVHAWPGSQLMPGHRFKHKQYLYRLDHESVELLAGAVDGLFDWVNPDFPDDPHLLRADESVVMGSITTEDDAWLELSEDELIMLVDAVPGLERLLQERQQS